MKGELKKFLDQDISMRILLRAMMSHCMQREEAAFGGTVVFIITFNRFSNIFKSLDRGVEGTLAINVNTTVAPGYPRIS